MSDRKAVVLVPIVIMTALALLNGCATTPLMRAVRKGNVSKVEKHIDEGADVDERIVSGGKRALHLAVRGGNLQIVILLIEAGANIDAFGFSYTPLMIAAEAGNVEMVRLLIKYGADVNLSNDWDNIELLKPNTALMAASWQGHSEVVQLLIDAGADVHYRDSNGDTALVWALNWGATTLKNYNHRKMLETAIVLVQGGADGLRALSLSQRDTYLKRELTEMLREVGAPNPHQLASRGNYSEISEFLKDWKIEESVPTE